MSFDKCAHLCNHHHQVYDIPITLIPFYSQSFPPSPPQGPAPGRSSCRLFIQLLPVSSSYIIMDPVWKTKKLTLVQYEWPNYEL